MYTKGESLRLAQGFTHEHSIFGTILIAFGGRDYEFEESVRELEEMLDDLYQASGIEGIYWGTVLEGSKTIKDRAKPGDKIFFFMDDVEREKQVPPQTPAILNKKQLPFT